MMILGTNGLSTTELDVMGDRWILTTFPHLRSLDDTSFLKDVHNTLFIKKKRITNKRL
jgi:hypothetical protein